MPNNIQHTSALDADEILPEYDLSGGVRGKYTARLAEGTNLVPLDPDVGVAYRSNPEARPASKAFQ